MRNNILILIVLFLSASSCLAGDYICFDENGAITEKYRSVDGSNLIIRDDCMKITREVYEALTQWKKVNDGKVIDLTQQEIDEILKSQEDAELLAKETSDNNLDVTLKEAFIAWLAVYNSKVPSQYQVSSAELIQKIKDNR